MKYNNNQWIWLIVALFSVCKLYGQSAECTEKLEVSAKSCVKGTYTVVSTGLDGALTGQANKCTDGAVDAGTAKLEVKSKTGVDVEFSVKGEDELCTAHLNVAAKCYDIEVTQAGGTTTTTLLAGESTELKWTKNDTPKQPKWTLKIVDNSSGKAGQSASANGCN